MSPALEELLSLLDLEAIEVNIFRGGHTDEQRLRTFGGLVAAQALVAAGRTVSEDKPVHSLHAYFLRPGDPRSPILYQVDRIRDGRSFVTRRVVAIQHGEAIFNLSASFHVAEEGFEHHIEMPDSVDPETLPTAKERYAKLLAKATPEQRSWMMRDRPIDLRHASAAALGEAPRSPKQQVWFRPQGTLPTDDPLLHACVVAYASDMSLLDSIVIPHRKSWDDWGTWDGASLDHAMWFHRPLDANQWLLYDQESPISHGARGLARGQIWSGRDQTLLVSVVQEGLIRRPKQKAP